MSAQGAEFVRHGEKSSLSGKIPQKMEPSDRPNLCHYLFSLGSGLEAEHTRFWQAPEASATLGWSSVQQGADHRKFLQGYGNANEGKSGGAPAEYGHGERYHNRLCCQEGRVSTDQRRKFHGCACAGFSCLWSHQRTSPACGWIYSQPIFCFRCDQITVAARKHELWECPGNSLINHTHTHI